VTLPAIGNTIDATGVIMTRLSAGGGRNAGACTGDSGGPVFADDNGRQVVAGVISWTTGPAYTSGCGGITGMTPLARYRDWIVDTARKLGTVLP
jgi:secreted trypsin-like serine protease